MTVGRRVLSWAPLGILVVATVVAASASASSAPSSTPTSSIGSSPTAPRLWTDSYPTGPASRPDRNERAATTEATELLQTVTVPAGWTAWSTAPAKALATPGSVPGTPNLVDVYRWWTAPGSGGDVLAFIVAHPPTGSTEDASGTAMADGAVVTSTVTDALPPSGSRFDTRQILFEVAPRPGGTVGIRVDVQVIWYPTRPEAESVPTGAARVRATVFRLTSLADPTPVVVATAIFTSPSIVTRLAHKIDSLALALPGTRSCPADTGTALQATLTFSGPPGVPVVVVHDDPNGCGSVSFTRDQASEPVLTDDGLLRLVQSLPGMGSVTSR